MLTFCLQLSADKNSGPIKPPKDTPLERRALLSLEKQLELEHPESKFDFRVSYFLFFNSIFIYKLEFQLFYVNIFVYK